MSDLPAKKIFITATDTDAGKTWLTAALIRSLLAQGIKAKALKPISCGLDANGQNTDIEILLSAQNMHHATDINLYCFALPAAPSQAAAAQHQAVDTNALLQWCQRQSLSTKICLIEGVGGLMVPITSTWLVSDWIEAMPDFDVWLVVNCRLGAINQTLLTLDKLNNMGRMPTRIFFNASCPEHNSWIKPTMAAVKAQHSNQHCMVAVQYGEQPGDQPNYSTLIR